MQLTEPGLRCSVQKMRPERHDLRQRVRPQQLMQLRQQRLEHC